MREMSPIAARVWMTLIVLVFVVAATVFVNSRFHGGLAVGIVLIVLPLLLLSFALPRLLPVRCPKCSARMRFRYVNRENGSIYAYICERCAHRHEWEGASGGSSLDS